MMIFIRLIVRVIILLIILVVAFFVLYAIDEQAFDHAYLRLTVPGAFVTMLAFIPVVARMRLGRRQ